MASRGVFSFAKAASPKLWLALSLTVFSVFMAATMIAIYINSGTALSAALIFFTAVSASAILHYLVYRSIRRHGITPRPFPIIFGVLSAVFWFGQLAWYSIPGVVCAAMVVVISICSPQEGAHVEGGGE